MLCEWLSFNILCGSGVGVEVCWRFMRVVAMSFRQRKGVEGAAALLGPEARAWLPPQNAT